jgi:transposase
MGLMNKRIFEAELALLALTKEPKRGRRQIRSEEQLHQEAKAILERFGVLGLLTYTFKREETTKTQYIGPGRGGKNRAQQIITRVRYVIANVQRDESAIAATTWRMGWRLYATNQLATELPLEKAYLLYRQAPRIERHFHLFKGAPVGLEPLYVRRDDQIKGLIRLLSLCVRLLTLIEIVVRLSLTQQEEKLSGIFEGNLPTVR